ncbi:hypothetical protein FRX31_022220 [Thalictrum thalictroides]|uniref:Uncharacterized protein n=1 Tax=Thalictrum thalictroides TaxID=46969 RepID=A0A7J6VUX0_THATH|nr:hypothetical protein FRX31_022220 [Thalictrum thalictroides]
MRDVVEGTPEVHPPEVLVNDKSLAITSPTAVAVPGMFINADREEENKEELEEYLSKVLKKYSRTDLEMFTLGFSESNLIGVSLLEYFEKVLK